VTDITYLWTQEGWLYLAVILDLLSRAIVGWALSAQMTRHLPLQALTMALGRRHPPQGLLHHSDRGSQPEFNWSSLHCLCEPIVGPHQAPRPVFASRVSFAAWC
jgi:transposase InsO family protein